VETLLAEMLRDWLEAAAAAATTAAALATAVTTTAAAASTAAVTTAAATTTAAVAATAATATITTAATATITTAARGTLASDVHVHCAAVQDAAVQRFDRALGFFGRVVLDETKPAGLTRHAVRDDGSRAHGPIRFERLLEIILCD
jgi:hypothetical protein